MCGEGRAAPGISDIKSIAGRSPLAVHTPSWGVVFPCPQAERSVLFSFPHHLLSQIPPSVSRPGVEFQPLVENKRERNPNPTCSSVGRDKDPAYAWSPLRWHPASAVGCFRGTPGCQWALRAACPRLGQREDGEIKGCSHSGILFPCMAGGAVSPNPIVSNYKAGTNPPSHLGSKERAGSCFEI